MTSLPISKWLREFSGVSLLLAEETPLPLLRKTKEMATANFMMIGVVIAMASASVEVLTTPGDMSWHRQFLMGLVGGSVGLIVNVATFRKDEELCPRKIARQTIASVFLAGGTAPGLSRVVAGWCSTTVDENLLILVATVVGLGGVYVLRQYGEKISEWAVKWGLAKAGLPNDDAK